MSRPAREGQVGLGASRGPRLGAGLGRAPRRWRPNLATVLVFSFGSLMLLALASVAWTTLKVANENTLDLLRGRVQVSLDALAARVTEHLRPAEYLVDFVAAQVAKGQIDLTDEAATEQTLRGVFAAAPQISGVALFRADGRTLAIAKRGGALEVMGGGWTDNPDSAVALGVPLAQDRSPRFHVAWIRSLGQPHVVVRANLMRGERYLGRIVAIVSIRALSEYVAGLTNDSDVTTFVLYGRDRVLAHPALVGGGRGLSERNPLPGLGDTQDPILAEIWKPDFEPMTAFLNDAGFKGRQVETGSGETIFVYRRIENLTETPWILGLYLPESRAELPFRRLEKAGFVALAIVAAAFVVAVLLGRAIARPIQRIAQAAQAIGRLDFAAAPQLPSSLFREVDQAARAFNAMLGGLRWFETYVPRALVTRLMRGGLTAATSEERPVTVLFTDIVGFTSLCEALAANQVAQLLNEHFALLAACIDREGGTLDKYIGDSVMAFWGAPEPRADHAALACRAAVAIAEALAAENARRGEAGHMAIRLRIGIHSGPVLVGNIGAPGRINYTLVGDAVNVAQRLEALGHEVGREAGNCTILVSGATAAQLGFEFVLEPLGIQELRGRSGHLEVFQLIGERSDKEDGGQIRGPTRTLS